MPLLAAVPTGSLVDPCCCGPCNTYALYAGGPFSITYDAELNQPTEAPQDFTPDPIVGSKTWTKSNVPFLTDAQPEGTFSLYVDECHVERPVSIRFGPADAAVFGSNEWILSYHAEIADEDREALMSFLLFSTDDGGTTWRIIPSESAENIAVHPEMDLAVGGSQSDTVTFDYADPTPDRSYVATISI